MSAESTDPPNVWCPNARSVYDLKNVHSVCSASSVVKSDCMITAKLIATRIDTDNDREPWLDADESLVVLMARHVTHSQMSEDRGFPLYVCSAA